MLVKSGVRKTKDEQPRLLVKMEHVAKTGCGVKATGKGLPTERDVRGMEDRLENDQTTEKKIQE